MAVSTEKKASDVDQDALERSYLTYLVPAATGFDIEALCEKPTAQFQSLLDAVDLRECLYFDETIQVYLVLRTPSVSSKKLQSFLNRITLSVEAQIVNSHAPDSNNPPATEVIYSGTVDKAQQPLVSADDADGESENGSRRWAYAAWTLPIILTRPKMRMQSPSITISATASLHVTDEGMSRDKKNGYMQSRVPSGLNLLEAFNDDPALGGIKPRLSAARVSRIAPVTQSANQAHLLKGLHSLVLKIYPVIQSRIRFARPNSTPPSPAVMALLEVDFTPYFDCEAILQKISLSTDDGTVEDLNVQDGMRLPLRCVAHDHITFMYRLAPRQFDVLNKLHPRDLNIAIEATILEKSEGPDPRTPHLSLAWSTPLDFTPPVNPGFGQPMTQPIQRAHRPSQLSIGGAADGQSLASPSIIRPDALPTLDAAAARGAEIPLPELGLTMTFTGPSHPIYAGDEFTWSVFVVNRRKTLAPAAATPPPARKLALLALPRRRRVDNPRASTIAAGPTATAAAAATAPTATALERDPLVAEAVLDETVVRAAQRAALVDGADVVCLSADVRVGPLAPDACAVAELRFLALGPGVDVGVEAVRVVDLGTQEHVDVRELPVVVVCSRE